MPKVSEFYGIRICQYYGEHNPPHFHAQYGEDEILVAISPVSVLEGFASRRVQSLVNEWATQHAEELMENWRRCESGQAPLPIPPLD
jgi:hypothetical protein